MPGARLPSILQHLRHSVHIRHWPWLHLPAARAYVQLSLQAFKADVDADADAAPDRLAGMTMKVEERARNSILQIAMMHVTHVQMLSVLNELPWSSQAQMQHDVEHMYLHGHGSGGESEPSAQDHSHGA